MELGTTNGMIAPVAASWTFYKDIYYHTRSSQQKLHIYLSMSIDYTKETHSYL